MRGDVLRIEAGHARGGELDREREPVDAAADLCDGRGVFVTELEVRIMGSRALSEQRDIQAVSF